MDFFLLKWSLSGRKSAGNPNSFLVPLKNKHLQSFKDYTKCMVGPGNLHIIIHGHSQYPALLHISSRQKDSSQCGVQRCSLRKAGQFEAAVRERQKYFSAVWDRHFFGRKELQSPEGRKTFWVVRQKYRSCEKWLVESCQKLI